MASGRLGRDRDNGVVGRNPSQGVRRVVCRSLREMRRGIIGVVYSCTFAQVDFHVFFGQDGQGEGHLWKIS